jgi:GTP pyrophosphokinase
MIQKHPQGWSVGVGKIGNCRNIDKTTKKRDTNLGKALFVGDVVVRSYMLANKLINQTTEYIHRSEDKDKISRAIELAYRAHDGRTRRNGLPYVDHVLKVANQLAEWQAPSDVIVVSLLHDTQEKDVSILYKSNVVLEIFGAELESQIRSVKHLSRFGETFNSPVDISNNNDFEKISTNYPWVYRLFCRHPQAVIVKLIDRLDSFSTIDSLNGIERQKIAVTTMNVFVPLADQLGMHSLKRTLQDKAYETLDPKEYETNKILLDSLLNRFHSSGVIDELSSKLDAVNKGLNLKVLPMSIFSFKRRMINEKYQDKYNFPVLIITKFQHSSHLVLGKLQETYPESEFGYKDYYALPKANGYRAIHTRVKIARDQDHNIFIQDDLSHQVAEKGFIASWTGIPENLLPQIPVLPPIPIGNITVFTPKHDMRYLPQDSTPLDFASAIHPEIIKHCLGAKMNGELIELDSPLEDGAVVEILRSESPIAPNPSWLNSVKTKHAAQLIKKMLDAELQNDDARKGLLKIEGVFERVQKTISPRQILHKLETVYVRMGYPSVHDLLVSVENGKENPEQVALQIDDSILEVDNSNAPRAVLDSAENLPAMVSKCCNPHPPDIIVGYKKRNRKISIHKHDCKKISKFSSLMAAHWETFDSQIETQIEILATNRAGLVSDVTKPISKESINMVSFHADQIDDGSAKIVMVLGKVNQIQLQKVLRNIKGVKNVRKVTNTRPGIPASFAEGAAVARLITPSYSLMPVVGPDFFGRNEEIKKLSWSITNLTSGNAVLIWGRRRIGKTSLLKEFQRRVLGHSDYVTAYLNLAQFSGMNHTRMLYEIINSIAKKAHNPNIVAPKYQRLSKDPLGYFEGFFNQFRARDKRPVILILDELETVFTFQVDAVAQSFYQYFRGVVQNREGVSFILGFGDVLDELNNYPGVSTFLNLIKMQKLGAFLEEDAKDLIVKPLRGILHFDDLVIQEILRLTNCHPYFIKLMCMYIYSEIGSYDGELSSFRFKSFLEQWLPILGEHYFSHIWGADSRTPINDQIAYKQLLIMSAFISPGNGWIDTKIASELFGRSYGVDSSKVQSILLSLRTFDVIEFNGDQSCYRITMPLLERWLRVKYPMPNEVKGIS